MDYEDLFLCYNALAEEAASPALGPSEPQKPSSHPVAAPNEVCDRNWHLQREVGGLGEGQEQRWPTAARGF